MILVLATLLQPLPFVSVYRIVTVPAATPETRPVVDTLAIEEFDVLQIPPVVVSVNNVVFPLQTVLFPLIGERADGIALTVTVVVARLLQPPSFVTV